MNREEIAERRSRNYTLKKQYEGTFRLRKLRKDLGKKRKIKFQKY